MLTAIILLCCKMAYQTFELKFGWFFINGHKQAAWSKYLEKKYGAQSAENQSIRQIFRQIFFTSKKK
jgi:hypothetical protein